MQLKGRDMNNKISPKYFFATTIVLAAVIFTVVLSLGAKPAGKLRVTFEYKVINQTKMFRDALRHEQLNSQVSQDSQLI